MSYVKLLPDSDINEKPSELVITAQLEKSYEFKRSSTKKRNRPKYIRWQLDIFLDGLKVSMELHVKPPVLAVICQFLGSLHQSEETKKGKLFDETKQLKEITSNNDKLLEWDKDDDIHLDFVTAASNLRRSIFNLSLSSRFNIKLHTIFSKPALVGKSTTHQNSPCFQEGQRTEPGGILMSSLNYKK